MFRPLSVLVTCAFSSDYIVLWYTAQELKDMTATSCSSLNSENPYATIKDLPSLPFCPPESSYMEMKSAVPRDRAYTEISLSLSNTSSLHTGD